MRLHIRNSQDLWAGILFMAIGAVTAAAALDYPLGATRNIGPGYFPVLLGGILIVIGAAVAVKGLRADAEPLGSWAIRPLILITAAVVVFALLVRPLGLAVATLSLVAISSLAGAGFSLVRVLVLSAALVMLAAIIFIYLLSLPFSLLPQSWN